jgi:hypothetical protein
MAIKHSEFQYERQRQCRQLESNCSYCILWELALGIAALSNVTTHYMVTRMDWGETAKRVWRHQCGSETRRAGSTATGSVHPGAWSLYVPPGLTVGNSTFCPKSVFMCFVWISEQTAIISLYSINRLVLITEESVYCAVRTGSLYVIKVNHANHTHASLVAATASPKCSHCCPPNTKLHRFVILLPSKHKTAPFHNTGANQTQK